jgi:ankyrin repeat protein
VLIKFGAQVDARTNNYRTPLHIACIRGKQEVIKKLVKYGADVNAMDMDGNTPCHFCSEYGHRQCLRFLLSMSPSLFVCNKEKKSAIDVAVNGDILVEF